MQRNFWPTTVEHLIDPDIYPIYSYVKLHVCPMVTIILHFQPKM
jgi:hypothetical protein